MTDPRGQPTTEQFEAVCRELEEVREEVAHLQIALRSARLIGTAIGILMCQRQLTQESAFALLVTASQRRNRKVRELAEDVVFTGEL